jgi:hypothetical protein
VWDEVRRLADITTGILIDTGAVISGKPFRAGSYNGLQPLFSNGLQPLFSEIRRDGLEL